MADHRHFTTGATSYLANLDSDDLREPAVAIHYQAAPKETETGTSISLRFPMLIVTGYLADPGGVAQRIADILERHWNDE